MLETARVCGGSEGFELDFVERQATPESEKKLGIHFHLTGFSLLDTVTILGELDVDHCRTTVHNWEQKDDLEPLVSASPDHVAIDETVIQLDTEQYWPYAAVDPATNRLLHARLYPTRTTAVSSMFLSELREKHQVDNTVFLVDGAPWLQAACHRHGLRLQHEAHGNRNSVEGVFREFKHRTNQFSYYFSHATAETVENWLQAFASALNQLI